MKKAMLICFTGIDGSGKSTLARALVAGLAESSLQCRYTYNRFLPFFSKPFTAVGKALFLGKQDRFQDYQGYSTATKKLFKNSLLSRVYRIVLLADYYAQVMLRVTLPLRTGHSLVCDRYIYDIVTDIAIEQGLPQEMVSRLLKSYARGLPAPDMVFLVDVPAEVAFSRKNDVPSLEYLTRRKQIYLALADEIGLTIIDGARPVAELQAELKDKVVAWMKP